eukprot:753424-Prorocentrum_lima.AAC.1
MGIQDPRGVQSQHGRALQAPTGRLKSVCSRCVGKALLNNEWGYVKSCLLYTSPSPRDSTSS